MIPINNQVLILNPIDLILHLDKYLSQIVQSTASLLMQSFF